MKLEKIKQKATLIALDQLAQITGGTNNNSSSSEIIIIEDVDVI